MARIPYSSLLMLSIAVMASGCAFGVTRVGVTHSPLEKIEGKQQGAILVRQFSDARTKEKQYIGTKRNGFGMAVGHIGLKEGVVLESLLTDYFVEALTEAGYRAVRAQPSVEGSSSSAFDAILEGEIRKFWLDLYMATWHDVAVFVKLRDKADQVVVWEGDIHGSEANVLWLGIAAEFEKVIRQALDKTLNRAVKEFASEEFARKLAK